MRTSRTPARTPKAKPAAPVVNADAPVANETIDHWIKLRCQRALTPLAFTSVADLYRDFQSWHVSTHPDIAEPSENAFGVALSGAPRIRIEILKAQPSMGGVKDTTCANLTLNRPLRAFAA